MSQIRKGSQVLLILLAVLLAAAILLLFRSKHSSKRIAETSNHNGPSLANLSLLESNRLVAKVGAIELYSKDLRDSLQLEFHGQMLHSSLSPEDLSLRIASGLDRLIEDELLAQEAVRRGQKTVLEGARARRDLAEQFLKAQLATLASVSDKETRNFYKNHGEKFVIPAGVQVRELFLPHQGDRDTKQKREQAYLLAEQLVARIRQGESLQGLGEKYASPAFLEKTKGYLFKGAVMDAADEQKVLSLRPFEVVGPLRVEGGYSIFQGISQVRARLIPFYEAQHKIKMYLERQREEELRKNLVHQLQSQTPVQRLGPDTVVAAVR